MGSLSDQLLNAGLVDDRQVKKVKKQKHKQHKAKQKNKTEIVNENQQQILKQQQEKVQRDRALNRQKVQEAENKAIVAQIKQLIELNQQEVGEDEVQYNFSDQNKIKRIHVSKTVHQHISQGKLAIVKLLEVYYLVPAIIAEKVKTRDESYIIVHNLNEQQTDGDEEYADYQIPDDLMW